jgi:glutathione synthase/RimK-type ligase-like ATP-grasp enzyme
VLLHPGNVAAAEPLLGEWGRALLKPRRGYYGQGVLLIEDYSTLRDVAGYVVTQTAGVMDKTLMLERFYEHDLSSYVSTTTINGSIMYGYRKRSTRWAAMAGGAGKVFDAESSGGEVDLVEVPPAQAEMALQAQKALGTQIIGFDMLLHNGDPVIVDENTYPGLYPELFHATGNDLGQELFRMIAEAIEECRQPHLPKQGVSTA